MIWSFCSFRCGFFSIPPLITGRGALPAVLIVFSMSSRINIFLPFVFPAKCQLEHEDGLENGEMGQGQHEDEDEPFVNMVRAVVEKDDFDGDDLVASAPDLALALANRATCLQRSKNYRKG